MIKIKKNKLFGYVMTGALSLGIIGGVAVPTFAATNNTSNSAATTEQAVNVKASLDDETKQKVQAMMDELKTQLTGLGVELPEKSGHGDLLANLDDATKEKSQALVDAAKAQLAELGVNHLPFGGFKDSTAKAE